METKTEPKDELKVALGKKVRRLRKNLKMTQEDLQRELGYNSNGMISQVEAGIKGMSVEQVMVAATVLGVHPAVLLSNVEFSVEELELFQKLHQTIKEKGPHYEAIKTLLLLSK
jgi:transcriptional regulator with XRE-family HTH domain